MLRERKPKAFFLENVKNLEVHNKGETFRLIKGALESLGYHIAHAVLNTIEYGNIPQTRERIYIVGFQRQGDFNRFRFPEKILLKKSTKDMLDRVSSVPQKYFYNGKALFERIREDVKSEDIVYQWRRIYIRENKSGVFPTLTANMGSGGHNVPIVKQGDVIRKITPKECTRIQDFPEEYKIPTDLADSHLYKQFGNSVSVPVVKRIAQNIYSSLL